MAPSTLHRWLTAGIIVGEQLTPGAPWRIRMTDELRARFVEDAPPGYVSMLEARLRLGVSRQTVLQRVSAASSTPSTSAAGDAKACESRSSPTIPSSFTMCHELGGQYVAASK